MDDNNVCEYCGQDRNEDDDGYPRCCDKASVAFIWDVDPNQSPQPAAQEDGDEAGKP